MESESELQTASKFAANRDNCGPVTDDQIDVDFPHGATCGCGAELGKVVAVSEPTEVPA